MAVKKFNTRIQLKRDNSTNFANFSPLAGELLVVTDKNNVKIGDGSNGFADLPYLVGGAILASYTAPTSSTTGVVTNTDTLDQALAKLQKGINDAAASGVQSIGGATGIVTLGNGLTSISGANDSIATKVNGYIVNNEGADSDSLDIDPTKIDSDYTSADTSNLATVATVTSAINSLDVSNITGFGAGKTLATLTETDGKIAATFQDISITSSQISDLSSNYASNGTTAITGTGVFDALGTLDGSHDVAAASTIENPTAGEATYKLELFDATETVGIISTNQTAADTLYFSQAYSASNPILTKADIGSLSGAMHFKGTVNQNSDLPSSGQTSGDVYIVSTAGTYAGQECEVGDMIIWNGDSWNVVTGENQVTPVQGGAELVAGAAATTIGTVDGVSLTARTTVTAGNATIASVADGVVTLKAGVTQGTGTGTIANSSGSDITLSKVATTGSANDITVTEAIYGNGDATTNAQTALTNLSGAISSIKTLIDGLDATVDADVTSSTSPVTQSVPTDDFNVLNSVTETNGALSGGTAYTLKKVAATGSASDLTVTSANYGGSTSTTNAQTALNNLAAAIAEGTNGKLFTSTTAQSVVSDGEPMNNDITLHQISKTGNTDDLIQRLTILFDCGSATTVVDTPTA